MVIKLTRLKLNDGVYKAGKTRIRAKLFIGPKGVEGGNLHSAKTAFNPLRCLLN